MHPLLTFSAGLVAGIAAIRMLKNEKTQSAAASGRDKVLTGLDSAQERLREVAISGLSAVEHSSARLRTKLTPAVEAEPAPEAAKPQPAAAKKPRTRKAPVRKTTGRAES